MRLEQLSYLVAIHEYESISLAAEHIYISQPALSSAISKLEDELGVVLLTRTNSGVRLTEIAELIVDKAIEVLNLVDDIKSITQGNSIELNGNISAASIPSVNITLMPDILTTFKKDHPKVHTFIKVGESNNILQDVEIGKANLGIIYNTDAFCQSKDMNYKELFLDKFVIITGNNNPDIKVKSSSISLNQALTLPILLYNTEYITNCGISSLLRKYGNFNVSYRIDNLEMMGKILSLGDSIAFVPNFVADSFIQSNKIKKIVINDTDLKVSIILIWSKRHHLSLVEKEFIKVIKDVCSRKD
ncbi:MAG TPA: LysR family transcriptional regulator [Lachnospiraceae bacterium]|jgi:DNA-binding transcriptional LysR family regulator|nr:LysR family transcriptional regulator [Lachnospiraceae bacterium]